MQQYKVSDEMTIKFDKPSKLLKGFRGIAIHGNTSPISDVPQNGTCKIHKILL